MPQMSKVELYAAIRRDHRAGAHRCGAGAQVQRRLADGAQGSGLGVAGAAQAVAAAAVGAGSVQGGDRRDPAGGPGRAAQAAAHGHEDLPPSGRGARRERVVSDGQAVCRRPEAADRGGGGQGAHRGVRPADPSARHGGGGRLRRRGGAARGRAGGPRPSPTHVSARPSSTGSPSTARSSKPAPTPTASPPPGPEPRNPPRPADTCRPPADGPPSSRAAGRQSINITRMPGRPGAQCVYGHVARVPRQQRHPDGQKDGHSCPSARAGCCCWLLLVHRTGCIRPSPRTAEELSPRVVCRPHPPPALSSLRAGHSSRSEVAMTEGYGRRTTASGPKAPPATACQPLRQALTLISGGHPRASRSPTAAQTGTQTLLLEAERSHVAAAWMRTRKKKHARTESKD